MERMNSTNPVAGNLAPSTGVYTHLDSERIFALRRYLISLFVVVIYALLDRSAAKKWATPFRPLSTAKPL